MADHALTLNEAAEKVGVAPATLRRWAATGVIPQVKGKRSGDWTPAALAHARIVARLRDRGHSLDKIREASKQGRLAYGFMEELFPEPPEGRYSLKDAAKATGLEPALIERY